ncbi:MAG TPA: tetratricopeptide repeat protein [Candidatus Kapabacteria bacterium]|nr:tetratricopeptide repeat protein [Candidatus Kapabacteria bacterium]
MLRNGRCRLQFVVLFFALLLCGRESFAQSLERAHLHPGLEAHSLDLAPVEELEYEQSLKQMRFRGINSVALHELSTIASRLRNEHATRTLGLQLDLFQSLAAYNLRRDLTSQRLNDRILSEAPPDSRVFAEASLLYALQHYSHVPLRRLDVEAGLERLRAVEDAGSLSAQTQPELTFWIAEGYRALGVIAQAEEYYSKTIDKASDPKLNALASYRRGELLEYQGKNVEAAEDYLRAANTARSPLVLLASVRRASALRTSGRYPEVLVELDRADSIRDRAHLDVRTSARELAYTSPLLEELLLQRTETDRIIGSTPDRFREDLREDLPSNFVLASPLVHAVIALLRGSAQLELGQYADAAKTLEIGQILTDGSDSLVNMASAEQVRFISNALQFEKAWALYQQKKYEAAAKEFLSLAAGDTASRRTIQRVAGGNLRERGRYADPFYEESNANGSTVLDQSLVYRTTVDTTFFFYNDFPERARFYAGVSLQRAGKLEEAEKVFISLGQDRAVLYSDRARYQQGLLNYTQKNYTQAEILLAPISLDRNVSGAYASYLMGEMTFRRNLYSRAEKYMANALGLLPDEDTNLRVMAHFVRGMSLVGLNAWEPAARELSLYAAIAPRDPGRTDESLFWLGKAFQKIGEFDSSRVALERLIAEYPESKRLEDAHYLLGWSQFEQNDYANAERSFMKVFDYDTISRYAYDVLSRVGDIRYVTNDLERSSLVLNQAVDRPAFNNYRTTRALYQLGVVRQRLDSARSAMNVFSYLINKFPNSDIVDRAAYNLALSAYTINQSQRAEQEVEKLVTQFEGSQFAPRGLLLVANERLRSNVLDGSLAYFNRVLEKYPTSREAGEALFGMQEALLKQNNYEIAIAQGEKFMAENPTHPLIPEIQMNQGRIQLNRPDAAGAQRTFAAFVMNFPQHSEVPFAKYYEAKATLLAGDTARGIELLQSTATQHADHNAAPFSYFEIARVTRRQGNMQEAARNYALAFQDRYYSSDAAPQAMTEYSQMLIDMGQEDSANAILREITERYTVQSSAGARAQMRVASLIASRQPGESRTLLEGVAQSRLRDAIGGSAVVQLGESELNAGRYAAALAEFARAKKDYSLGIDAETRRLFGVARAQEALGRKSDAAYALRVLLGTKGISANDRARAQEWLARVAPRRSKASPPPKATTKKAPAKKSPAKKTPAKKGGKR